MHDSFYRAFEDRHRGSRELIRSRLNAYEPLLDSARRCLSPVAALDLGCGRGEWLEMLGELGWSARGVDLDEGMLAACRERGFAVAKADALATLRAQPPNSLALVSAFHLVEHIGFDDVRMLIAEALRVLQPGGVLILETPNPENLSVGACTFYMDPSHERPLPPALLGFAVEHAGFARQTVYRLQEPAELHGASPVDLFSVLTKVSPDYAIVAQKSASEEILAQFTEALQRGRGLGLAELANRHDAGVTQRIDELAARATDAEHKLDWLREVEDGLEVKVRSSIEALKSIGSTTEVLFGELQSLESLEVETSALLHDILAQVADLQARTTALGADLEARTVTLGAIYSSRSWRYTAPLRAFTGWLKNTALGRMLKKIIRRN